MNNQQNIHNKPSIIRLPLVIGVSISLGLYLGATFFGKSDETATLIGPKNASLLKEILQHIDESYVDPVDTDTLLDYGITKMLEKLDPHTSYIPVEEAEAVRSQLQSGFDGIGVEFNVFNDSVFVVTPLAGGPSEAAGIRSGDIILSADGQSLTGKKAATADVYKVLRGPKNSKVTLQIKRRGYAKPLPFTIVRDKIPTFSIDAAYLMEDKKTGFIRVNRFAETTYDEFKKHTETLLKSGMKQLILDLRGNPGGYMDRATDMLDEFIEGDGLLLYTEGQDRRNNQRVFAGKKGLLEKTPVVVLIDEGSASASEIVSGTLQDYDRAWIVGRRTFGKGLVQAPIPLSNGAELRLTISRYYIPSKRSIQKPFVSGDVEGYQAERYTRNAQKQDSTQVKTVYKTLGGRPVFGGGGITPDVIVPADTSFLTVGLIDLFNQNILQEFTLEYTAANQKKWQAKGFAAFQKSFFVNDNQVEAIFQMAKRAGVVIDKKAIQPSIPYIKTQVKALIARTIWQSRNADGLNNAYYQIVQERDREIKAALGQMSKAAQFAQ